MSIEKQYISKKKLNKFIIILVNYYKKDNKDKQKLFDFFNILDDNADILIKVQEDTDLFNCYFLNDNSIVGKEIQEIYGLYSLYLIKNAIEQQFDILNIEDYSHYYLIEDYDQKIKLIIGKIIKKIDHV